MWENVIDNDCVEQSLTVVQAIILTLDFSYASNCVISIIEYAF